MAMDPGAWNGQDHNLPPAVNDDFQQFLDIGGMSNIEDGLQFDFYDYNAANDGTVMHTQSNHRDGMDTPMSGMEAPAIVSRNGLNIQNHIPIPSLPSAPTVLSQIMSPQHTTADAIKEIDAQIQFLQHQRLQQQQRQLEEQQRQFEEQQAAFFAQQQRNLVPPTPQSLEIQAANQYYARGDQTPQHSAGVFDRFHRLKDQQYMSFTPLVSPAVTPLDAQFPIEAQYTVPGACFSPLSSPALHAQNQSMSGFEQRHHGSATTNSPVERELEVSAAPAASIDLSKKVRKKPSSKARKANVRQSPITKPQRRKTVSTPVVNAQALSELTETAEILEAPAEPTSASALSVDDSENSSVSPEALSDMPPPPIPPARSARPSPYIQPQNNAIAVPHHVPMSMNGKPSPATPASLFRISPKSKSADASHPGQLSSEHIDNFELPESANFPKPQSLRLITQSESQSPPEVETAKVSALPPLPSPIFPRPCQPASSSQSPQIGSKSSIPSYRKTPLIAPRGSKKRSGVSSAHVSPALRPKISPSIKPMLPGTPGMSAEDSASRLLTSKSNYQNILEGNKVPGVSYPSELSTNLTSKRTSHKLAEQGRRNRINTALQEIASLLPRSVTKNLQMDDADSPGDGSGEKKDGKSSQTPNSKASTVELAIEYIKQLQSDVAEANMRAEEAERKLKALS